MEFGGQPEVYCRPQSQESRADEEAAQTKHLFCEANSALGRAEQVALDDT